MIGPLDWVCAARAIREHTRIVDRLGEPKNICDGSGGIVEGVDLSLTETLTVHNFGQVLRVYVWLNII